MSKIIHLKRGAVALGFSAVAAADGTHAPLSPDYKAKVVKS